MPASAIEIPSQIHWVSAKLHRRSKRRRATQYTFAKTHFNSANRIVGEYISRKMDGNISTAFATQVVLIYLHQPIVEITSANHHITEKWEKWV